MTFWKGIVLVVVLTVFYLFAPRYFPAAVLIGIVTAVTTWFRTRDQQTSADTLETVERACNLAGLRRHPFQKRVKFRRPDAVFSLSAFTVTHKGRPQDVVDLSSLTFRKVPLAFVLRTPAALVKEAQLVENSRIPGVRFEYQLKRVELGGGLEAAANMPDLLMNIFKESMEPLVELFKMPGVQVQKIFFNGRILHTHFVLPHTATGGQVTQLIDRHHQFHLTLLAILNNVNFNVPL
jgi:hypothetical protein